MNRRELLKFSLLAPLADLFKKKEPKFIEPDELIHIPPTTGTFKPGDRVWIGHLPNSMSHFQSYKQATVLYSYRSKYGSSGRDDTIGGVDYADEYALDVDGYGFSAWYPGVCLKKYFNTTDTPNNGWYEWHDENGCHHRSMAMF